MKIVQINATCGIGSTGKICQAVSDILTKKDVENYILYSIGNSVYPKGKKYSNIFIRLIQTILEKFFGRNGFYNYFSTRRLLKNLRAINPDIIHIHNIHSHDVNLIDLFNYIKENKIKVFWTFHDCWAFTGGCNHFDGVGCTKWLGQCGHCPIYKKHSFFIDNTSHNFYQKMVTYADGVDMTIITPSVWLKNIVLKSFLKHYPVKVINNGINLEIFKPIESDFKSKYNCEDKIVLLGVSFVWGKMKGLDLFVKLANDLDSKYQIVLVGTDSSVERELPSNIISINRTNNQYELAKIYSSSDIFLQLTREENFPTVNIEALACGLPVITFNTGGSPEILDENCGVIVEKDNYPHLVSAISTFDVTNNSRRNKCIERAKQFSDAERFLDYLNLY